jgi:hypothetical protein
MPSRDCSTTARNPIYCLGLSAEEQEWYRSARMVHRLLLTCRATPQPIRAEEHLCKTNEHVFH